MCMILSASLLPKFTTLTQPCDSRIWKGIWNLEFGTHGTKQEGCLKAFDGMYVVVTQSIYSRSKVSSFHSITSNQSRLTLPQLPFPSISSIVHNKAQRFLSWWHVCLLAERYALYKHCEYQGLPTWQVYGEQQVVAPVHPFPPHCAQ